MPPRYGQRILTPTAALEICRLKRLGMRVGVIARRFGVSSATVSEITRGRLWRDAGTPRPTLTPRQRQVLRLLAEGYTTVAVGRRLGITATAVHSTISRIADRYELEPDPERTAVTQIVIEAARRGDLKG
jgi:DNA-binding NarL/FixJ family response regulator